MSDAPEPNSTEQLMLPPNPDPDPARRRWLAILLKAGAGVGVLGIVGVVGFVIWGDRIITQYILPRIEVAVEETIDRPIRLGESKGTSLWGVNLGKTVIPPTETDESSVTVDEINVAIGLRSLIFQRTIKPEITLVRPNVSLVQSEAGTWGELSLPELAEEGEPPVTVELQTIRIKDAQLTADPYTEDAVAIVPRETLEIDNVDGLIEFYGERNPDADDGETEAEEVSFEVSGNVGSGNVGSGNVGSGNVKSGEFDVNGTANLAAKAVRATLRAEALQAAWVNPFLPDSLGFADGLLSSNLTVETALTEDNQLDEAATSARGTASFREGTFLASALTDPVDDIRSRLVFSGQTVTLEEAGLRLGEVALLAAGDVDFEAGYDLTAQIPAVSLSQIETLSAVDLPDDLAGIFRLETQLTGALMTPEAEGRLFNLEPVQADRLGVETLAADFELMRSAAQNADLGGGEGDLLAKLLPERLELSSLRIVPEAGGEIVAQGSADLSDLEALPFQLVATANGVPADAYAQIYDLPIPEEIVVGTLSARLRATGTLAEQTATADWQLTESTFPGSGEITLADNIVQLENTRIIPTAGGAVTAQGSVDLSDLEALPFQVAASAEGVSADAYAQLFEIAVPNDVVIGRLSADLEAAGTLAEQTATADWRLTESTFPGSGEITLVDDVVLVNNTRLRVAEGIVTAEAIANLREQDWQANVSTSQVPVEQFTRQAQGRLDADIAASGRLDALNLAQIQAAGTATIAEAQVYLPAGDALLERGDWATDFVWQGDRIAVNAFTAPGVQAEGTIGVDFSQSIPVDTFDLDVALQAVDLQPFNSFIPATFEAYGEIAGQTSFDGELFGTPDNPQLEGIASLDNLAVNELLFEDLSGPVALSLLGRSRVDLQGEQNRIQLALQSSAIEGYRQRTLPELSFEVRNQEFVAKGFGEDRQLFAEVEQLPLSALNVRPAAEYGLGTVAGLLDASVSVDFSDFSNPEAAGTVQVLEPALDPVDAERFSAEFAFADGTATVEQGELLFDDSRYLLTGSASLAPTVQYAGELTIAEGRIEDLIAIAEQLDLSALGLADLSGASGSAADLETRPVGLPAGSFLTRLESFGAFLAANPPEERQPGELAAPPLDEIAGEFTGEIVVAGELPGGTAESANILNSTTADFDLQGEGWTWGVYSPDNEFTLSGGIQNGAVTIDSRFASADDTAVTLAGTGSMERLRGQLVVDGLPVEIAELFYPLPAQVEGSLSAETTFRGSLENPVVVGEATVANGRVNGQPIETVGANFDYRNALLRLDSEVALTEQTGRTPITVDGTVPYALPFATVRPRTEQISLKAVVPNNNLEIVNALTNNQVQWQSGQGSVVVDVGGTLSSPVVQGQASFREGAISSTRLEDALTNVTGDVQFDLEKVSVEQLQATVGDGQIAITGELPLLRSGRSVLAQTPLSLRDVSTVSAVENGDTSEETEGIAILLNDLPVDYTDTVQAELQGQIFLSGAVLSPTISGNIEVNRGAVQANQLLREIGSVDFPTAAEVQEINPYRADFLGIDPLAGNPAGQPQGFLGNITLQNFELVLGDRTAINGAPLYNILAIGDVTVSGPLNAPRPDGVIELVSGWINLFSTQFRIDTGAANTATFTPETGLDPDVDVVLQARVQDADITPTRSTAGGFAESEVAEAQVETFGNVEFIEVEAIARGPASELSDNLVLTSNSSRSERELLALLGSNVVTGITGASVVQVAEFLGAGTFSNISDQVASAVGLESFSVFPTTDPDEDSAVGIGIGIEATAGIGDRFDVNFLQVLNSSNPPRFGVEYRITDQLELQSSTNLENTDFGVEYQIRF
ncbi:MAG: translocation/assembly module TamB domain-containing protein [Cyanobacteria bacterium J06631_12]